MTYKEFMDAIQGEEKQLKMESMIAKKCGKKVKKLDKIYKFM